MCGGDQLELTCNTTGSLLEWRLTVPNVARLYRIGITSDGGTAKETTQLQINTTTITFSRITNVNEVPLLSMLLINSVNASLNGTEVICENIDSSESASTTIIIQAASQSPS